MEWELVNSFQSVEALEQAANNGYKLQRFGEVFLDVSREFKKIKKKNIQEDGQYPVVDQSEEFISGYTDVIPTSIKSEKCIIFGDHSKTIKYVDFPFVRGADGTKVLKLRDENFDIRFFYHFLKSLRLPEVGYSRYYRYLNETIIPVPPADIQRKLAKLLDENLVLISKRQEQMESLDDLVESVFYEMFGKNKWDKTKIKEVARIDANTVQDFSAFGDEFYLGVEDIEKETGKILSKIKVKDVEIKSSKNRFTKEHILYSKIRPYLNKVALPDFNGLVSTDVFPILCGEKTSKYFLLHVLRSNHFVRYASLNATGANIPRINRKIIENYSVNLPPIALQNRFADIVRSIEEEKQKLKASLEELETLFNALMQEAFSGNLV